VKKQPSAYFARPHREGAAHRRGRPPREHALRHPPARCLNAGRGNPPARGPRPAAHADRTRRCGVEYCRTGAAAGRRLAYCRFHVRARHAVRRLCRAAIEAPVQRGLRPVRALRAGGPDGQGLASAWAC